MDAPANAAYGSGITLAHPAPAPVPSGRLVLRSRADVWRYGCDTAIVIVLIPIPIAMSVLVRDFDRSEELLLPIKQPTLSKRLSICVPSL